MAGDWIKMRYSLATDPKVLLIARHLEKEPRFAIEITGGQYSDLYLNDVTLRYIVTGALHVTWCAVNDHVKDGVIEGATTDWIDQVCAIDGFGKAMESVGWVVQSKDGLQFPKFYSNNTSSVERVRKFRAKQRENCNGDVTLHETLPVTIEKRREEKSINTPLNPPLKGGTTISNSRTSKRPPKPDPLEETIAEHKAMHAEKLK